MSELKEIIEKEKQRNTLQQLRVMYFYKGTHYGIQRLESHIRKESLNYTDVELRKLIFDS
ncbi:MAG: hypothetical protein IIU11_08915 [Bacteroidales bacterium]|jgi:hypothetical protein|nr:hypothetical protein [Bacteroidales bacterium]